MRVSSQNPWQRILHRAVGALALGLLIGFTPNDARAICGDNVIDGGGNVCVGDCSSDTNVTVDEIVTCVNIALGTSAVDTCTQCDGDGGGSVTVDEIITSVNNALNGCPAGAAAAAGVGAPASEECDNGGLCVGGSNAGTFCDAESDCQGDGACFGGPANLRGCDGDDDCPSGTCRRCRPYGGDGCAANCTQETEQDFNLVPGVIIENVAVKEGTSGAVVNGPVIPVVPLPLIGTQVFTVGKLVDGSAPITVPASGVILERIPVSTIACACVRGAVASTCGGTLFDKDGAESANCTPGFTMIETCPVDKPCAPIHGPGNTGSGFVTCGAGGVDIEYFQDCNGTPGAEPLDPQVFITDRGTTTDPAEGSVYVVISSAIGTVVGACTGTDPAYGGDGQFCTTDDALANRGSPNSIPFTTNMAVGTVLNPADFEGDVLGPFGTSGASTTCNATTGDVSVGGTNLAGVFTACDQPTINDILVPVSFVAQQ